MFITEAEILDTPQALAATVQYFSKQKSSIAEFFVRNQQRKFTILGCGSSYMLAKSAAALFDSFADTSARAIPAGDYILDPEFWKETVRGSTVIALSRSGLTSEMVMAVKHIRETLACPTISLTAKEGSDLSALSDLDMAMPWIYDNSVCQTRTVANLYAAILLLASEYAELPSLWESVLAAGIEGNAFHLKNRPVLEDISAQNWDNAVVLADGPVCGIAEEGALAFTEIAMLPGRYFHLLDYRHGPIVIGGERTLTLMLLRPGEDVLQGAMVRDVIGRGGIVVTVSDEAENRYGANAHIQISGIGAFAAWGIPFIYIIQMIALLKAVALGGNPDQPAGLDPYISLASCVVS